MKRLALPLLAVFLIWAMMTRPNDLASATGDVGSAAWDATTSFFDSTMDFIGSMTD